MDCDPWYNQGSFFLIVVNTVIVTLPPKSDARLRRISFKLKKQLNKKTTMLHELSRIKDRKTGRFSSWDTNGRNADFALVN